jgi:hypothetical protein
VLTEGSTPYDSSTSAKIALTTQQAVSLGGDIELLPGLGLDPAGHVYAWAPACTGSVSAHVAGMGCVCRMAGRADSSSSIWSAQLVCLVLAQRDSSDTTNHSHNPQHTSVNVGRSNSHTKIRISTAPQQGGSKAVPTMQQVVSPGGFAISLSGLRV